MKFTTTKKDLLNPLKTIIGVIEQRQTLPILSNTLVGVKEGMLHLTATDSEVEICCSLPLESSLDAGSEGETTIPARKFYDICRALPDESVIQVNEEDNHATIKSGKSRFKLSCLPAEDFPSSPQVESTLTLSLPQKTFKSLLARTSFCAAVSDVRYYLNGICLDFIDDKLNVVATDGHRLALATEDFSLQGEPTQVIIPRKAIIELTRMLEDVDNEVEIAIDKNHIKVVISDRLKMSSKLIDGKFPDYQSVLPLNSDKIITTKCSTLKQALSQAAILSNEKHKGVRLVFSKNMLRISARNPEQEESEVECEIDYSGEEFEIGFNVSYLLEALAAMTTSEVELRFSDPNASALIMLKDIKSVKYVVMPMRL